jgi:hypothetical protein
MVAVENGAAMTLLIDGGGSDGDVLGDGKGSFWVDGVTVTANRRAAVIQRPRERPIDEGGEKSFGCSSMGCGATLGGRFTLENDGWLPFVIAPLQRYGKSVTTGGVASNWET